MLVNQTQTVRIMQLVMLFVVLCLLSVDGNAKSPERRIKIERDTDTISAELVDAGDYYFRPDGKKVKLFRKKDVFALRGDRSKYQRAIRRYKQQYGDRVKEVRTHRLGAANVIRLDNRQKVKTELQQFDINANMLSSLDSSVAAMEPVFTTEKNNGDLLLLSKITLKLNNRVTNQQAIARLTRKYGLSVNRKLRLSDDIYSLSFTNAGLNPNQKFAKVRAIMNEAYVDWAEPQFFLKPTKTAITPDDTLFSDQWHLTNQGFRGSRCDADCDAGDAWDEGSASDDNGVNSVSGEGVVIAVVDDGVELTHPDLQANIWINTTENVGIADDDDDGNGYDDDINGYDFVDDASASSCANLTGVTTSDGDSGQDADPSPRDSVNCVIADELLDNDNHGTAVAGIIAAQANNTIGVAGVAYNAEILPVRAISDFDEVPFASNNEAFCDTIAEAMEYAAQHADVINNSWSIPIECSALESALIRVTAGTVTVGLGSKRDGVGEGAGSVVVFASGNQASGWVKVTASVSAGEHAYEWRFLRDGDPESLDTLNIDQAVWLDDITWPDGSFEGFESMSPDPFADFAQDCVLNTCDEACDESLFECPVDNFLRDTARSYAGTYSAKLDMLDTECANVYLHNIKGGPSGEISFWVWVSTATGIDEFDDQFEFLIDGEEVLSYGDLDSFGFVDNAVAYPARLSATIDGVVAVGASTSGDLSGTAAVSLASEQRASYSQFGPTLDLVAPSSDQHLGITTTDRTGADGYDASDYTNSFGGTSASAAIVSGVAAAIISIDDSLSASTVRTHLRDSADEIGTVPYSSDRNDEVGHGRVNMWRAVRLAQGASLPLTPPTESCTSPEAFDYITANDLILPNYTPQGTEFCPAVGPVPDADELCVPIKAVNGNIALICL